MSSLSAGTESAGRLGGAFQFPVSFACPATPLPSLSGQLAGATQPAQAAPVQQLQYSLSESTWKTDAITARTLQLLGAEALTSSNTDGVLVVDTGDRKDGCAFDPVARQNLGSVGKIDNGINAVTTLWAHQLRYYRLHVTPYTPQCRRAGDQQNPAFLTKPQIALSLVERASRWHCVQGDRSRLLLWRQPSA